MTGHRVWNVDGERLNRQKNSQYIIRHIKGNDWDGMFNFSYFNRKRDGKQTYEVRVESPDKKRRIIYVGERREIGHPADLTKVILESAPYGKNNEKIIELNYETSIWNDGVYRAIGREIERKEGIAELRERAEKSRDQERNK